MNSQTTQIQQKITQTLSQTDPKVEVLLCDVSGGRVRLFIDHPDGVDLGLCERVTRDLTDLLVSYSLEVSSPGPDRPLSKPEHFKRFVGRRARIRTRGEHDGRQTFIGELVNADDDAITIATDGSLVSLSYGELDSSKLVADKVVPQAKSPSKSAKKRAQGRAQKKLNSQGEVNDSRDS